MGREDMQKRTGNEIREIACCRDSLVKQVAPGQRPFRTLLGGARVLVEGGGDAGTMALHGILEKVHGTVVLIPGLLLRILSVEVRESG
jgi:hypothetical protein